MDNCPKCGGVLFQSFGTMGVECVSCRFQLRDAYGRTYEERMKAREPFEPWRKRVPRPEVVAELEGITERDRIARRLIDSIDWGRSQND